LGSAERRIESTVILSDSEAIGEAKTLKFGARRQMNVEIEALEYLVGHLVLLQ
jgi:hypothetical protein